MSGVGVKEAVRSSVGNVLELHLQFLLAEVPELHFEVLLEDLKALLSELTVG